MSSHGKSWEEKLGFAEPMNQHSVSTGDMEVTIGSSNYNDGEPLPKTTEASFEQQQVHTLAKGNLDFLAALAMPDAITFDFPITYIAVWNWLLSFVFKARTFPKLALGLPRGFAKTTLIKIFILFCILFTERKFILVIGATSSLAENILGDIVDMLDEANIKRVFGDWRLGLEKDTQGLKKFGFRGRNIILAGIGQGTSLRGLNIKNSRPDIMIFEDIQSREDAESQTVSEAIERWMIGTAMKAKAPTGCMYLFIANMYPTKWSLLRKLKANPSWTKFIAGGILADGTSLWEDLQPIEQLLEEFQNDLNSGHPEIFYSEVLNDENASVNNNVDISKIPQYPYDDDELIGGSFIIIDPSNDKINSDAVSIGLFQVIDGTPVAREILEGSFSPGDTIRLTLELAIRTGTALILIEANAFQYSLCYWFTQTQEKLGLYGINALPIYSGSRSKNSRILDMLKSLVVGEIVIHPECWSLVVDQIIHFNPLKSNNTDGILDLLCYATRVLTEFPQFIAINNPLGTISTEPQHALEMHENCCF